MNSLRWKVSLNIDFSSGTTIVSAELEHLGGHKTSLKLKFTLHFNVLKAVVGLKVPNCWIKTDTKMAKPTSTNFIKIFSCGANSLGWPNSTLGIYTFWYIFLPWKPGLAHLQMLCQMISIDNLIQIQYYCKTNPATYHLQWLSH